MNIFVLNSGSSSIKYQLFNMPAVEPVCSGLLERIGTGNVLIVHKTGTGKSEQVIKRTAALANFEEGLKEIAYLLTNGESGVIKNGDEIHAVGHRVVHGGSTFTATTVITDEVSKQIKDLFPLAPLHNPANYQGIDVAKKTFPKAVQVAVFDTAFHQTMPDEAFLYAIPLSLYKEHQIRAYGFHGTSHKYVSKKAGAFLGMPDAKLITLHLGNGCSMAAVKAGKSLDTSMGFGPLSGLLMGTRSGDLDPSVVFHLVDELGYDLKEVDSLLNKQSGLLGITGLSDMRDIEKRATEDNREAELGLRMYAYRAKKYIGAYAAVLNGLDAIVFTAGVGENSAAVRERICSGLEYLGIRLDVVKNNSLPPTEVSAIQAADSAVQILVIHTNEELEIASQCYELLQHQ